MSESGFRFRGQKVSILWIKFNTLIHYFENADLIEKLDNLFENDPKAYWSLLDELKENKKDSLDSIPSLEELFDHFSNLNKLPSKFVERAREIDENLKQSEFGPSFCKLDFTITKDEIINCLRNLKKRQIVWIR